MRGGATFAATHCEPLPNRTPSRMKPSRDIASLLDIMAALRTPVTGCPWDLEQSFRDDRALYDRGGL